MLSRDKLSVFLRAQDPHLLNLQQNSASTKVNNRKGKVTISFASMMNEITVSKLRILIRC